jgi:histidyl-tRNA synthetase
MGWGEGGYPHPPTTRSLPPCAQHPVDWNSMTESKKTPARPTLKAVRGTRDLLPDQTPLWNHVEATARALFARYGFGEIRTPIFETTELFARGVGEETDIVSKEMFTWEDGERFNESAAVDAWLQKHASAWEELGREVKVGQFTVDLIARHKQNSEILIIEFKQKFDGTIAQRLRALVDLYAETSGTMAEVKGLFVYVDEKAASQAVSGMLSRVEFEALAREADFFYSTQSLTLRPESTAGVVRAYIEHKLGETGQLQKLYYIGPQFRRERPQRGRYRQFWQIGAEVIGPQSSGSESPLRDAEILEMLASLLTELGIRDWRLELNSVGSSEDRIRYNAALREALQPIKHQLCEDNQRRAETNPLRVLDSKDEADQDLINALPKIADYLSDDSRDHFTQVLAALDACNVPYNLNPRLVRGLDYYTRTTFEFTVTTGLGTQNALLGGGRYDGLSEMLGGPKAPGIGFAIGEDRLILTLQAQAEADNVSTAPAKLDAYIAPLGTAQNPAALALARELRTAGLTVEVGDGSFKLRKSFDVADTVARHIILLGEDEVATNILTVKTFSTGEQVKLPRAELSKHLSS